MNIIGHRGARGLAPENTIASIEAGILHGADEIEIDVRVTKDGLVVLHHDKDVNVNGTSLRIAQHTYARLREVDANLTLLDEALSSAKARKIMHIEVKRGEPVKPIVDILLNYLKNGMYSEHDMLLGSKSQKTLVQLHRALPNIEKVVIESWSGVIAHWRARQVNTKRISMRATWLWRGFVIPVAKSGYKLYAYTVNDPKHIRRYQKYLYGVITDYPDRFVRYNNDI